MTDAPVPDDLLRRLRGVLGDAGYTEDAIGRIAGRARVTSPHVGRDVLDRQLTGRGRLETLVRLFAAPLPVDEAAAQSALSPVGTDELADAGLVAPDGGLVRPLVRILAYDDLLIAFDVDAPGLERPDFVTGINPSARALAALTIRRPVASTLDLGTGSGIQALLAARHSRHVTATDVNPRALAYLRLNARLNGIEVVEPLEGSWFEPVRGRRFELVVSNPPYVVSPDAGHVFRDGGLEGDGTSRLVVEQLAEHLEEDGTAQVLCNWTHAADEDWRAPLEDWVRGRGVDALLLRYETLDPLDYAVAWNRTHEGDRAEYVAALDRWLAYDARLAIERLSWGMVVLRRRTGARNRVRAVEVPGGPTRGAGAQVERMLAAWDAPLDEDALAAAVLRPAEGAEVVRRLIGGPAGWTPGRAGVRTSPTMGFDVRLDDAAAAVVARCDGRTTVAEALARAATEDGLDAAALAATALPALRRLHLLGCLVPPDS